jgi:hypothetical protein
MARPIRITVGAVGASAPVVVSTFADPINIGIGVKFNGATTGTWSVQHTFDDPFDPGFAANAVWYPYTDLTNIAINEDGNYAFPVTAIRLNVLTLSSGAPTAPNTITMTVIPAGF